MKNVSHAKIVAIAPDLTKQAPRSPALKLGGYVILARMTDKCRATLVGNNGEYHYDCPLDRDLSSFKKFTADDFKDFVSRGESDEAILAWINKNGAKKTQAQIDGWSQQQMSFMPYTDATMKDWFVSMCKPLGLDAEKTTLFEYLIADDAASFKKHK